MALQKPLTPLPQGASLPNLYFKIKHFHFDATTAPQGPADDLKPGIAKIELVGYESKDAAKAGKPYFGGTEKTVNIANWQEQIAEERDPESGEVTQEASTALHHDFDEFMAALDAGGDGFRRFCYLTAKQTPFFEDAKDV